MRRYRKLQLTILQRLAPNGVSSLRELLSNRGSTRNRYASTIKTARYQIRVDAVYEKKKKKKEKEIVVDEGKLQRLRVTRRSEHLGLNFI